MYKRIEVGFVFIFKIMESVIKSIDDVCDLTVAYFTITNDDEEYFYFNEQSSLQVLREFPLKTVIHVTSLFSERQRIFQKIDTIKDAKNIKELFEIVLPLVEHGNFPCTDFTIIIDNKIKLTSHDDGEVHLVSSHKSFLRELIKKILIHQRYDQHLLNDIVSRPSLYHLLERPDKIISSYSTFEEVIDAL